MNYKCSHPECAYGYDVEGHHIIPLKDGGVDAYWNIIALCKKCHRENNLHSRWQNNEVELFTWKSFHELNRFGFYLDEKEPDFYEKYKKAILTARGDGSGYLTSFVDNAQKMEISPVSDQNKPIRNPDANVDSPKTDN